MGDEALPTLHDRLRARAAGDPDTPAILSPGSEAMSAEDLVLRANGVAELLSAHELGRSDRIAVVAGLGPQAAVAVLGVASRATCVPVHPAAAAELPAVLAETDARALVAPGGATPAEREAAQRRGIAVIEPEDESAEGPAGEPAGPDDVAMILRTSGTTRKPKLVPATHRQLVARAEAGRQLMDIGPSDRCLCPMPLCYGHGIFTGLVIALLSGGSTILPREFDEEAFVRCLSELAPTWYTAGPAHQQAIAGWLRERPEALAGHRLRFARCANGALAASLTEELERLLGVPMLDTYGMSEAGMIASPDPSGPHRTGTVGAPIGVDVAVLDEAGSRLDAGTWGEVVVRGPTVFSGYEGDEGLNRRAFAGDWFRTGDRGMLDEDGFLTLDGRMDDMINRGGQKVSPAEVEATLCGHAEVADAVVFAMPHSTLGQDLAAVVRLEDGAGIDEGDLRDQVRASLAAFKVPRRIVIVPELPLAPSGKTLRRGLAERFGLDAEAAGSPVGDGEPGPLEGRLAELWAEVLEVDAIGVDDDFFTLGGDSLSAVELLAAVASELGVEPELEDLVEAPTPRLLAGLMLRGAYLELHAPPDRGLVSVNEAGTRPPLFAVGGRPGYALRLLLLARGLGSDQPVHGLQPPGMDWTAAGESEIPGMAAHYLAGVRRVQPQGPYRLLGSSFGGLVVFEMARQLEEAGEKVGFLGLIDTEPPAFHQTTSGDELPSYILEHDEEHDAGGPPIPGAISDAGTRVGAIHAEARGSYAIENPVGAAITLFNCAAEGVSAGGDRRRLWGEATTGGLRLVELPGLHASFDREPQFSSLRDALDACLSGEPPAGSDPDDVFGRRYSLEASGHREVIRNGTGQSFRVEPGAMRGRVRAAKPWRGKLLVRGWASDAGRREAGRTVVAFIDGQYAGYSTCGAPSERLERRHAAPGLRYAGFRMRLLPPSSDTLRVFALSPDGRASELAPAG